MTPLMYSTLVLMIAGGIIGAINSGPGGALIGSIAGYCVMFLLIMWYGGDK